MRAYQSKNIVGRGNRCFWCGVPSTSEYLEEVKFATPREESCLRNYNGGYIRYRHACLDCGARANLIASIWMCFVEKRK